MPPFEEEDESIAEEDIGSNIPIEYGKTLSEDLKKANEAIAALRKDLAKSKSELKARNVVFKDNEPYGVIVNGRVVPLDDVADPKIYKLLDDYYSIKGNISEWEKWAKNITTNERKIYGSATSAVGEYLSAEDLFKKRVQFYIDAAKDILNVEDKFQETANDAIKFNREQAEWKKATGLPLWGERVFVPKPGWMNPGPQLRGAVGLAGGGNIPNPGEFASPDEWARAAGVPGYAAGTKSLPKKGEIPMNKALPRQPEMPPQAQPQAPPPVPGQAPAAAPGMAQFAAAPGQTARREPLSAEPPKRLGIAKPAAEVISSNAPAVPAGHPASGAGRGAKYGISGAMSKSALLRKKTGADAFADVHKQLASMSGNLSKPTPFPTPARWR